MAQGPDRSRARLPFWLLVLAGLEVVGGALGVALCARDGFVWLSANSRWSRHGVYVPLWSLHDRAWEGTALFPLSMALGGLLYSAALLGGILILRRRRLGLTLSVLLQCLQVPLFRVAGMGYSFIVGGFIGAGLQWPGSEPWTSSFVGSDVILRLYGAGPPMVGLNFIPVLFLFLLTPTGDVFTRGDAAP
jgi:hypothetical protein